MKAKKRKKPARKPSVRAKKRPARAKKPSKKVAKGKGSHLRQSKTDDFMEKIRKDNSMVEYFTKLRILNPAATLMSPENQTRREGSFVRLAHAREEFTAPVLTKGKAALSAQKRAQNENNVDSKPDFGEE